MFKDDMNYEELNGFKEALPKGFSFAVSSQISFSEVLGWEKQFAASAYCYCKYGEKFHVNICKAGKTVKEACDAVLSDLKEEIPND